MFDSSSELLHRGVKDLAYTRRHSDGAPYSHQQFMLIFRLSEERNAFGGYQPQLQQKKIFGFEIFVGNDIIKEMPET